MLQISSIIKEARIAKGLTQQEVADLLKEKRSTYAEWERKTEPQVSVFMKLAEILELNPMEVFKQFNIDPNKRSVVESKLEELQNSLNELKLLLSSETSNSAAETAPPGSIQQVRDAGTFLPGSPVDKSKVDDQASKRDRKGSGDNKSKG